ncbi:MAG: hypothetical protein Kow0060_23870 [Methylohalobius crimeensis]
MDKSNGLEKQNFVEQVQAFLKEELHPGDQMTAQRIAQLAIHVGEFIRLNWGGDRPYIDKGVQEAVCRRNEQIRKAFNGRNHEQVCAWYGISRRTLYLVLNSREF